MSSTTHSGSSLNSWAGSCGGSKAVVDQFYSNNLLVYRCDCCTCFCRSTCQYQLQYLPVPAPVTCYLWQWQ